MTARQIIIKCLDENTDVTCRKHSCDKPEKEGNTGRCCHKCSLEILREYDRKIHDKAIDKVINQLEAEVESSAKFIREYDDSIAQKAYYKGLSDALKIAEELKGESV